jgi:tetratricopeptide (TPR) repeat protein
MPPLLAAPWAAAASGGSLLVLTLVLWLRVSPQRPRRAHSSRRSGSARARSATPPVAVASSVVYVATALPPSSDDEPAPSTARPPANPPVGVPPFVPRVFISHSGQPEDNAFGQHLAAHLRAELGDADAVWYDRLPERSGVGGLVGGQSFPSEIVAQISSRNVFIILVSPSALRSRWVAYEVDQIVMRHNALARGAILPVWLPPSRTTLPRIIANFHAFDFTDPTDSAYARALEGLVAQVRAGVSIRSESAPPLDDGLLPAPDRFIGRDDDLAWVLERLRAGGAAAITAVGGMGGIGKTALAAAAVRVLIAERRFPDGIAVVLCQDRSDALGILRDALTRFDPGRRQPEAADAAGLAETAHNLLDGKRALVVLDNVEPACPVERAVAPLRAAGAAVLITARHRLAPAAVPADGRRSLDVLPESDALELFAQALGRADAAALTPGERDAALRIVRTLDRHTLAVKLAGASAARRDLAKLASELENPQRALRLLEGDAPAAVQHAFASSYDALPADSRRLFAGLAAFATAEFGREAALAVAEGLGVEDPTASLDTLVARALLDALVNESMPPGSDRERLRLHPLLRAFAEVELAHWPAPKRDTAYLAIAYHYAAYANATPDLVLVPDDANIAGALEWIHEHASDVSESDDIIIGICNGLRAFWRDTGRTRAGLRYLPWGSAAAERVAERTRDRADNLHAANIAAYLGDILANAGQLGAAEQAYQRDLARRQEIDDRQGEGVALSRLGQVAHRRGRLEAAEAYYHQALAIVREVEDHDAEGFLLSSLGQILVRRGRLEEAEVYFQRSLAIRRESGDTSGEGVVYVELGEIAAQRGQVDEAEAYFLRALAIARETQDRQSEGAVIYYLALVAEKRGDLDRAETLHRESLDIAVEVQSGPDIAVSLLVLGRFLIEHDRDREEGCRMLGEAEGLYHEMGMPDEEEARAEQWRLGCTASTFLDRPGEEAV